MTVEKVDLIGDRAQRARRILGRCVRRAIENQGDDIAGFALVSWNMRGEANSSYFADVGPVGRSLMPAFVHDALNRHVAVELAEETGSATIGGGA